MMAITTSSTIISTAKEASPLLGWPVTPAPETVVDGGPVDIGFGSGISAFGYAEMPLGTGAIQLPLQSDTVTTEFDVISTGANADPGIDA